MCLISADAIRHTKYTAAVLDYLSLIWNRLENYLIRI